jgi:hypothetical protein
MILMFGKPHRTFKDMFRAVSVLVRRQCPSLFDAQNRFNVPILASFRRTFDVRRGVYGVILAVT